MKFLKSFFALALALLLSFGLIACKKDSGSNTKKYDPNKTQLYIGNFNGGYGYEWLDKAIDIFEKKFEETQFESGKKGVQIWVTNQKDEFQGYNFYVTIANMAHDLFIAPQPRMEITQGNLILDLSETVSEPLTEFGENKSILQKMKSFVPDFFDSEKIQFIPLAEAYFGNFTYDVDLFEEKEFFFAKGGGFTGTGEKSLGPDGIAGTYDDGMPVSEAEFLSLLNRMYINGVTPFTFAGQYLAYPNSYVFNLSMNYDDGAAQNAYNTLTGTIKDVNGNDITITPENGWEVQKAAGKLEALKLAKKLVSNTNYYSNNAFKTTQSHIEAQDEFVVSVIDEKRVGMIIEGTWWENEALDTFNRLAKNDKSLAYKTRRFGIMPSIKPNGSYAQKTTFLTSCMSTFINANTTKADLSKLFVKFLFTDEVLKIFNTTTGCPTPYEYELSADEINNLSYFGKQLYEISKNENGKYKFLTEARTSELYVKSTSKYPQNFESNALDMSGFSTVTSPFNTFYFYPNITAQDYFNGLSNFAQKRWEKDMLEYLS